MAAHALAQPAVNRAATTPGAKPEPAAIPTSPDPVEIAMEAVAPAGGADNPARLLLLRQTRLVEVQIRQIHLRRWLLVGLALLVLLGIGSALWNASRDHSLVIEAFSAPPDFDVQGLGGEVLAGLLLDKLVEIDSQTQSWRARETLKNDWAGDIKVDIPNTGISIGQIDRGLHQWLGRQTHVEGSLFHRGDKVVLTVRADGGSAHSFAAAPADVDGLLQQAAEALMADSQSYLFSKYLEQHGRIAEALAVARKQAAAGPDEERAWAYAQVSNLLTFSDLPGAVLAGHRAVELDPRNALGLVNLAGAEALLGHDESALQYQRIGAQLQEAGGGGLSEVGRQFSITNSAQAAYWAGDYSQAVSMYSSPAAAKLSYQDYELTLPGLIAASFASEHDVVASRAVPGVATDTDLLKSVAFWDDVLLPEYQQSAELADWPAAVASLQRTVAATQSMGYLGTVARERFIAPLLADALARNGDTAGADQLIAQTPLDCYRCVRMRGRIAAVENDTAAADRWFGEAVKQAPSRPFAYAEWGEAKLARGDSEGAIELFRQAQEKGPRWADPLKFEGDALALAKSADALGRYAAAAELAPHWGALYLAWGRALDAQGDAAGAQQKYRAAREMGLSAADRTALGSLLRNP
jgi:tetratricopeptide (TPR) repeat protein